MADNDAFINIKFTGDAKELEKLLNDLSDKIGKALGKSISGSVKTFAQNLAKDIQISLDTTSLASLKKPIKIQLDTKDAEKKVNALVKPLSELKSTIEKLGSVATKTTSTSTTTGTTTTVTGNKVADNAKNLASLSEGIKYAESLGSIGQSTKNSLTDIQQKILAINKAAKEGVLTDPQQKSIQTLTNKAEDLVSKLQNLQSNIQSLKAQAGSGKSPVEGLEQGLDKVTQSLIQYGFNEKTVAEITKKVAGGVDFLKEQYNLLFDELAKGEGADLSRILTTQRKIENATALAESRIKTIQENRGNISSPFELKSLERDEAARIKAQQDANARSIADYKAYKAQIKNLDDLEEQARKVREKRIEDDIKSTNDRNIADYKAYKAQIKNLNDLEEQARKAREKRAEQDAKSANARNLADIKQRDKVLKDIEEKTNKATSAREIKNLRSSVLNKTSLEAVAEGLRTKRKDISTTNDIPINVLNKQTRQYDSTVVRLENNLENLNREYDAGNISVEEAVKKYKKLEEEFKKLQIGIDNIDAKRLASEFNQEEADPRRLGYRLGILAFTLNSVGQTLTNFSRNFFQIFQQLGQAAEPIERVTNALALQVKQGKITGDEQEKILRRLREIGDLPGSSVESANQSYNALQRINLSLEERLNLTEGLAKLAASPGGTPESAQRLSEALSKSSLKKKIEQDNLNTIRETGGASIVNLLDRLGLGTATEATKFGVSRLIKEIGNELNKLEVPASTTSDRINRLTSRLSELGRGIGKLIGPGLDDVNILLRDKIVPALDALIDRFEKLPDATKQTIGDFIIAIPIIAGIAGGFISLASALGFAVSGLKQISELKKFLPEIKNFLGFGKGAASASSVTALSGGLRTAASSAGVLTRVFSGLKSILAGLFSPISLILSAFIALYENTNRLRERFVLAFSELDRAVSNLLKQFGYDGGLLDILLKIFDILGDIFSFVGGGVLSVIIGVITQITELVDDFAKIKESFTDGNILQGIKAIGELLKDTVLSIFSTNVVISLAAFVVDVIGSALESTIGAGVLSNFFRNSAETLRRQIGTDNESLDKKQKQYEIEKQIKDLKDEELDAQKQLAQAELDDEENRKEIRTRSLLELNNLIEKTKEDFIKYQSKQAVEEFKSNIDVLKAQNEQLIDTFKRLADASTNLNLINQSYAKTLAELAKSQKEIVNYESEIKKSSVLSEFRELTSPTGELKALYDGARAGQLEFTFLVDKLEKARSTSDFSQIISSLDEIQRLASAINLTGLSSEFPVIINNITEKTRALISTFNRQEKQTAIEYQKRLIDLNKFEIQRKFNLEEEKRNAELEFKNRQDALKRQLEDIRQRRIELQNEKNDVLDETKRSQRSAEERRKRLEEKQKQIEEIDNQIQKERGTFYNRQSTGEIPNSAVFEEEQTYKILIQKRKQIEDESKKIEQATQELFSDETALSFTQRIKELSDILNNLNQISEKTYNLSTKLIGTLFPDNKKDRNSYLKQLIDDSNISRDSGYYLEINKIFSEISTNSISASEGIEKLIDTLVRFKTLQTENDAKNALSSFNKGVLDFAQKYGTDKIPKIQSQDRSGIENFLYQFAIRQGGFYENINAGKSNLLTLADPEITERLKKLASDNNINTGKGLSQIIQQLLLSTNQSDKDLVELFFTELFKVEGFTDTLRNQAVELVTRGFKAFEAKRLDENAKIQADIEARLAIIENNYNLTSEEIDSSISSAEGKIELINSKLRDANSKERDSLLKQQRDIKLQLIDFNYQKLDLEEAYNIQKAIIQANGNATEIKTIQDQGKLRRELLKQQRDQELKDLVISGGANINSKGELVDANGNPIKLSGPTNTPNVGLNDTSGDLAKGTSPSGSATDVTSKSDIILNNVNKIREAIDGTKNAAYEAGSAMLSLWDSIAQGDNIMAKFKELLGGASLDLHFFGDLLKEIGTTIAVTVANGIGKVIADALVNGVDSLKDFGKVIGDMLIQIGILLVQSGIAAVVLGTIGTFIPALRPLFGGPETIAAGAVATAAGAGMILLGKALGGGQQANVSNTGVATSAGASAGTSGQVEYDPEKDPKLIYQKALRTEVYIDIKRDDSSIVKAVIKEVNRNPAFGNLIGNNRTGFVL